MIRKKLIYKIITIVVTVIVNTIVIYLTKPGTLTSFLIYLFLFPVIITSFSFGFKAAFITSIICSFIYAPDYMLFFGKLNKELAFIYLHVILFNLISILFSFFIEKWKNETKKINVMNTALLKANSELKELISLRETLERQERLAAIGTAYSGIAHELRNPLSIIKTSLSALSSDLLSNPEVLKTKKVINEEINKAQSVIKSVLGLAKEGDFIETTFDLSLLIKNVITLLNEKIISNNIDIICQINGSIFISGDEQKLSRVFFNLFLNSIDAIKEKTGGWIKIEIKEYLHKYEITIRDNGFGIKEKNPEIIFNPFYTTKASGTGLGLSICFNIIKQHNGDIFVRNTNSGAEFTIILKKKMKE